MLFRYAASLALSVRSLSALVIARPTIDAPTDLAYGQIAQLKWHKRQDNGTTTTVAAPPPSTPTPTPTPQAPWTINITVGSSSFLVGDISDGSTLAAYLPLPCGDDGCDGGSPQSFDFNASSGGGTAEKTSGQFLMYGNYPETDMRNAMLLGLQTALSKSISCQTQSYTQCSNDKRDPETGSVASPENCGAGTIQQCTVVNYLSAEVSDPSGNQKGSITMQGSSTPPPAGFDCGALMDVANGALDTCFPVIGVSQIEE